ncbi:MAG: UDP-N-acetylmuramate dehydrogenase [Gemmatimonadota bacterium]
MRWRRDVPLAGHTRYGIGGPTSRLGVAVSEPELREALAGLEGRAYRVLGGGANVLVADEGVREPVLILGAEFEYLRVGGAALEVGAATKLPALVGEARRLGRRGWAFLEAVPGSVGGGLRMNAGSREEWLWDRVQWAEAMTPDGEVRRIRPEEANAGYRQVGLPAEWIFIRTALEAPEGDPREVRRAHLRFREQKVSAQVYDLPSVGSTWKNPGAPFGSAWEVVERVGMRGARRGGAQISEKHANFIVNHGEARAEDVLELMIETRRRAVEQLGVRLEPEIVLWGFAPERVRAVGGTER